MKITLDRYFSQVQTVHGQAGGGVGCRCRSALPISDKVNSKQKAVHTGGLSMFQ